MGKIKLIMGAAVALLVLGGLGGWLTYSSAGRLTDVAEVKSLEDSFADVLIHTDKAWLDIRPTDGKATVLELAGQVPQRASYSFDAQAENGVLTISVKESSGSLGDFMFPAHLSLVISLPEKQYRSLQLEGGGNHGQVRLAGLKIDEIQGKTSSSGIALQGITAKNITLETGSAPIALTDINCAALTTKTYSAPTELENVEAGVITARAVSGQISLATGEIDRQLDLETNSGDILVQAEREPVNVRFEVASDSGTVNLLEGSYIGGTRIGGGEHRVRLASQSGSITIEAP